MYFDKFPKIEYGDAVAPDISIRYKINTLVRDSVSTYELYRLSENEKPEDVAYRVYGDVTFHWVILMMNDISDPLGEWYRNDTEMDAFLDEKYANPEAVHHYEDADGYVIPAYVDASTVTVTNRDYEERINDSMREIKILRPEYLYQLISDFESTIDG